jgi:periplasmic divalent cation tolerance protein
MEKASEIRIVFVTTGNFESALQISKILVTEKLAACCSIIQNVTSIFGWQEAVQERTECMLIIKTTKSCLNNLEIRVSELHSDEVPEIIALNPDTSSESYAQWVRQSVSD